MNGSYEKAQLRPFKWMGAAFIGMAIFFAGGAYLFPVEAPIGLPEWFYLSGEEKESFYMISLIFLVASIYCFRKQF